MKSKTEQLNELFKEWRKKNFIYKEDFRKDGIINEQVWHETKPKILFICKEPIAGNHEGVEICRWKKAKVIDFYHPSSRIPPAASYSLLQNIVKSEVFQSL